jgi:hypothetical protein
MLLRKDLHRLFDLGLLCVEPNRLEIDVHSDLHGYPNYAGLHGKRLSVALEPAATRWLKQHWEQHR